MDARAFEIGDDTFDAAFAIFSVSLLPHRDESLREMVRVVRPGGKVCVLNWATRYGHPGMGITVDAMDQLGLLEPGGLGAGIAPLEEAQLVGAGCVDVSLQSIELPAELPAPDKFHDELGAFFVLIPGYSGLSPAQRADLAARTARAASEGAPWTLAATLGVGRVPGG